MPTAPPTQSPQRDLHHMASPLHWTVWPFLPLVRRRPDGETDYGVLFDAERVCNLSGLKCTVYKTNLFLLPGRLDDFLLLPHETFDTFEEVVAAGWRVD